MRPDDMQTRESLEACEAGRISVVGPEEHVASVSQAYLEITEATAIVTHPLRLIELTNDIDARIRFWEAELGRAPIGASKLGPDEGFVAGKSLTWGDGGLDSTYAIVLISVPPSQGIGRSLLAHELGHVHDSFMRGHMFREEELSPLQRSDWPGLRSALARSLWGECAANLVASSFADDWEAKNSVVQLTTVLLERQRQVRARIDGPLKADLDDIWDTTYAGVEVVLNQLGRAIGMSLRHPIGKAALRQAVPALGTRWQTVGQVAFNELSRLDGEAYEGWGADWSDSLEQCVELSFRALGVYPSLSNGGLRVDLEMDWSPTTWP